MRNDGKYRRRSAVHHGRAETAYDPRAHLQVRQDRQVVQVLEDREAGAYGKSEYGRIDEEADAVVAHQHPDDERFERFLDKRREIARVGREIHVEPLQPDHIQRVTRHTRHTAEYDRAEDPFHRHELVAVQVDQCRQEATDGKQAEQGV